MLLTWMLWVVMPMLTVACAPAQRCRCTKVDNVAGTCFIDQAAPKGFKCACNYGLPRAFIATVVPPARCIGEALPCRNDEACPGGRYSYCACVQGGGDCEGYPLRPSTVKSCHKENKLEASHSLRQYSYKNCECDYFSYPDTRGCRIVEAAQEGFKCGCRYDGMLTCHGQAIGCDEDEYCPADDYTYCGCLRGSGNCDGYLHGDRNQVCSLGSTCDCDRSSDWSKGRYSIVDVSVDIENITKTNPVIHRIANKIILRNELEIPASKTETFVTIITSEFSFEHTYGISLQVGIPFVTPVPITLTPSATYSFKYGEKITTSKQTSHTFTCNGPAQTLTQCEIFLESYDTTGPYTMLLKHNEIPDCVCRSNGIWRSTTSYTSHMSSRNMGPCLRIVSGKCVAQ